MKHDEEMMTDFGLMVFGVVVVVSVFGIANYVWEWIL